jgi:hypothetical protein
MASLRSNSRELARGNSDFNAIGPDGSRIHLGWFRVPNDDRLKFRLVALGREILCSDADLMMATFHSLTRRAAPLPPLREYLGKVRVLGDRHPGYR